ncbi:MAG: flagellar hook-length control protein FliK [Burkholderiaceae bacterium]
MNDLNLAALQATRQANASGSRAAQSRDAGDPAADFDRVMARVARQDAAAARPREASAGNEAQPSDEDPAQTATATTDAAAAVDAGAAASASANAMVVVAPQFASAAVTGDSATDATAPQDRTPGVDSPSGVKPFAASAPQAPLSGHVQTAASPADTAAGTATTQPADGQATPPRNAARTAAPVAPDVGPADAQAHTAAARADAAFERVGEAAQRRFEPTATGAQPAPLATSPGAHNAVASALAAHASPTYSIAHARIATPVLDPAFGADLANRVVFLAGQRVQSAEIALTPADLGPLSVTIELRGQEAHLVFGAAHATTRAAIEDALPRLREMFAGSGLQLADAQIGDHGRRDSARPQRGSGEPMRAIGAVKVAPDLLRPTRPARPDRLIDVVV